jgi:hypothetical protein
MLCTDAFPNAKIWLVRLFALQSCALLLCYSTAAFPPSSLVVSVFLLAIFIVGMEVYNVRRWAVFVRRTVATTMEDPEFDPTLNDHIIPAEQITLRGLIGSGAQGERRCEWCWP